MSCSCTVANTDATAATWLISAFVTTLIKTRHHATLRTVRGPSTFLLCRYRALEPMDTQLFRRICYPRA